MSDTNSIYPVPDNPLSVAKLPTLHTSNSREAAIANIRNSLRCGQQQMADWKSGPLAVSAVPGAGKSTGMAAAAAIAIARQYQNHNSLRPQIRRQLVVVTFTRSAAANIKAKIRKYLREGLSLPQTGFVVYTLHGLALNIASRHPQLSGLELDYVTLITPNQSHRFIRTAVERWITSNPRLYAKLMEGMQFDGEETERLRRQSVLRTEVLPELATTVIHEAKSSGMLPEDLHQLSEQSTDAYEVLKIAAGLYEQYQNLMRDRDFIDYDDMILAALRVLDNESARKIEQNQVFAVFEDEAQDSSPLQTKLLEILASEGERESSLPITNYQLPITNSQINLIRVGDPNQAINSTFTPADPIYFRQFCQECDSQGLLATMNQAGRSSRIIIETANFALEWVNSLYQKHQKTHTQSSPHLPLPFRNQRILSVDFNDPQPNANPAAVGRGVEIYTPRDIHHTVELLSKRIIELFPQDNENNGSAAILVRENRQGTWLSEALRPICKQHNISLYDVGEQDRHSHVPEEILAILQFCDRPHSADFLKAALGVLVKRRLIEPQDLNALASLPEEFLYPSPLAPLQTEAVKKAGDLCRDLLNARLELPLYQLISFIALKLEYQQAELATADKLSERINQQIFGNISMGTMLVVLSEIVSSERFEPVDTEDSEARYTRRNQLTIITMHKAKGLDWDYVFLPFLHENLIPGKFWVPPQRKFLGDFTLSEVARAQIRAALHGERTLPDVTAAWEQAKHLKIAEEYRLFYVAMTRAKRLLWISAAQEAPFTWSKPNNLQKQPASPVFNALKREFTECVVG
ncbi:ATP-dependent helicase [Plectonema cf. radiosum LEGE 06105]|uniref:DNA 3'-5' helicase n=1 Tax=Plectonema cf. radiosum LEGE 06105 TaxID=945769 RepID=A0A8J7F4Q4_9CYAN|nr:ATP-dependent helicase [Plectonema radiosum]MBE9213500.1 ATP-dependent helicase [Plectonema cf. radiosum LEGE 06105]